MTDPSALRAQQAGMQRVALESGRRGQQAGMLLEELAAVSRWPSAFVKSINHWHMEVKGGDIFLHVYLRPGWYLGRKADRLGLNPIGGWRLLLRRMLWGFRGLVHVS